MILHSILFQNGESRVSDEQSKAPDFFVDLNLDQIVAAITVGREEYDLQPFFHVSLCDVDAITWRHEIMQDLEVDTSGKMVLTLRGKAVYKKHR